MAFSSPLRPSERTPRRQRHNSSTQHHGMSALASSGLLESPSQSLVLEFRRLWNDQNKLIQQDLDAQLAQQAERHREALAQAAAEHDRVRKNAEVERERVELEIERERKRRDAEERDRLEAERQAKVAREAEERRKEKELLERQQQEAAAKAAQERAIEAEKARIEELQRQAEQEAAQRKQQQEDEAAKAKEKAKEAVLNAARAREEKEKAAQAAQAQSQPVQQTVAPAKPAASATPAVAAPTTAPATAPGSTAQPADPLHSEFEDLHKRYLELHKQLKKLREHVIMQSRNIPALKDRLGDWRRQIVQSVGQLTRDKSKNRQLMAKIQAILTESASITQPAVDVSPYLISVPHPTPGQQLPVSGCLLYLLNIFSKAIITQFIDETGGTIGAADPVGVVAVSIFAAPALKLNQTVPLIDILLAKYHKTCPLLFCLITGTNMNTPAGRTRIGWTGDTQQRHLERMTALSAGWAALSLRDFSKSKNTNPLPNYYYWRALAGMANTPPQDVGKSHVAVIKALIDGFVPRLLGFYGVPARALLKAALVDLPAKVRARNDQAATLAVAPLDLLREELQTGTHLTLA